MGWLWLLREDGVPYRVPAISKPDALSDIYWISEPVHFCDQQMSIRQLAATSSAAYALDASGAVYVFLHPSFLFVRRSLEIYENQRWYPVFGWKRPLPTDWSQLTTSDGDRIDFEHSLPSTGWRWEEGWEVQRESNQNKEGWQFAPLFGRSVAWRNSPRIGSFVRRRRWKRSMRYVAAAKWIPIPDDGYGFSSIAAGCSSSSNGGCILFAVGLDGGIYRRHISHDLPEGDQWVRIEEIRNQGGTNKEGWMQVEHGKNREDVVLLSCSPTFSTLLAITWDGKLYLRLGISSTNLSGTGWQLLPTPEDRPVTAVSIGIETMWLTTADGQLWMHRIELNSMRSRQDLSSLTASTYRNLGTGSTLPAISAKDQLFVLQGKQVFFREGITSTESTGKSFVPLIERTNGSPSSWLMVCPSALSFERIPSYWTNDSFFLETDDTTFKDTEWRRDILSSLEDLSESCWDIFQQYSDSTPRLLIDDENWERSVKIRLRLPSLDTYMDGILQLSQEKLFASAGKFSLESPVDKILRAEKSFEMFPFKFCLILHMDASPNPSRIQFAFASEKERDNWHESLQKIIRKCYAMSPKDSKTTAVCWSIGGFGQPRFHPLNELILDAKHNPRARPLNQLRSLDVEGHFQKISAGVDGVVWTLTEEGQPFALSPKWNAVDEQNLTSQEQRDVVTVTVTEIHRHQFLRGFQPFLCQINGLGPLERTRMTGAWQGSAMRLPSQEWSWNQDLWQIENAENDDGWTYAVAVDGSYGEMSSKTKFRRRKWTRKAFFKAMTPWIAINSPSLKDVFVQRDKGDRILVWGLTMGGEILVRQGVEHDKPQGFVWKQIVCNSPLSALFVASPTEIWGVSDNGRIFVRSCEEQIDMEATEWSEQPIAIPPGKFSSLVIHKQKLCFIDDGALCMLTTNGGELHRLCTLMSPSALSLDHTGNLAVVEGGQMNRHHEWLRTETTKGRLRMYSYSCKKREPFETGFTKCASFTM